MNVYKKFVGAEYVECMAVVYLGVLISLSDFDFILVFLIFSVPNKPCFCIVVISIDVLTFY